MLTSLAGALDDGCDEVDPVLREVVAVVPFGVAINAIGVLEHHGRILKLNHSSVPI